MSEIDFAEIEKAMAELVNKAQGKEREQGLDAVAHQRSQTAKHTQVAQEQGDIATKRIIVASNNIRSNPHPRPQVLPPSPGRVMDFTPPARTSSASTTQVDVQPEVPVAPVAPIIRAESPAPDDGDDLQKTVGELSNEYLREEVSGDPSVNIYQEDDQAVPDNTDYTAQSSMQAPVPTLEDIAGPSPVMGTMQEPTMMDSDILSSSNSEQMEDQLPEADELSEDIGQVHKIYGQKLPKEYLNQQRKDLPAKELKDKTKIKTKKSNNKNRKGLSFYFVIFMVLAAVSVWGLAAYLFFVY